MTTALLRRPNIRSREGITGRPKQLEVEDFDIIETVQPVSVDRDRLMVDSRQLDTGRVYQFSYLDSNMVLWKSPDNTVDIYQIVEE